MSRRLQDAADELAAYRAQREIGVGYPDPFSSIESVAAHEGNAWKDEALDLLHVIARTKRTFTVEDLDRHLPHTVDKRVVGWVLRQGARERMDASRRIRQWRQKQTRPAHRAMGVVHRPRRGMSTKASGLVLRLLVGLRAVLQSVLELLFGAAQGAGKFRQFGGTEQQDDNGDDEQQLPPDDLAEHRMQHEVPPCRGVRANATEGRKGQPVTLAHTHTFGTVRVTDEPRLNAPRLVDIDEAAAR